MYLDKPMRDHVLLQAIARVNRPYEDDDGQVKPYGFVLDYVGIFEKLEKRSPLTPMWSLPSSRTLTCSNSSLSP